jgi:hypothetical protein
MRHPRRTTGPTNGTRTGPCWSNWPAAHDMTLTVSQRSAKHGPRLWIAVPVGGGPLDLRHVRPGPPDGARRAVAQLCNVHMLWKNLLIRSGGREVSC